ncbi:MAG TPA: alpha-amylase family glycosyl hydrolase, partial [Rubricoccaceae bacterium]
MRPTAAGLALLAVAGCVSPRYGAVDVPPAPAEERTAEPVVPVVRVVAGRADTLLTADLLGPGLAAVWGASGDATATDVGGGRVAVAAREGFSGLTVVPYTVDGGPHDGALRGLAVEAAVEPAVTFRYDLTPGRPAPASVHVIGGFNDWSRTADPLVPDGRGGLTRTRSITPGRYEYKLVVDGAEVLDPTSRDSTLNPFGAYNNVLTVAGAAPGRLRLGPPDLAEDRTAIRFAISRDGSDGVPADLGPVTVVALVDNAPVETRHVVVVGAGTEPAGTAVATVDLAAMPAGLHRLRVAATAAGLTSRWVEVLLLDGHPLGTAQTALDEPGDPVATGDAEGTAAPFVWQDAVVYQVVLDRFRNGDRTNDRPVLADSLLAPANYHGGDLQGLLDAIESGYFTGLGVNTLWLSPVYDNPPGAEREYPAPHRLYTGYHGYWPSRARAVDEHLGSLDLLRRTVAAAHARGLQVHVWT